MLKILVHVKHRHIYNVRSYFVRHPFVLLFYIYGTIGIDVNKVIILIGNQYNRLSKKLVAMKKAKAS